jgi:hypothetical protein
MDLQVGGISKFYVTKTGNIKIPTGGYIGAESYGYLAGGTGGNNPVFAWDASSARSNNVPLGIGSTDVLLYRDAANTLALRNGTAANTLRVYGSFTDSSNARRLDITSTTAGVFTLTATGNGTGASGNILKLTAPILLPSASVSLATNGDLAFEATSNTSLTIRYRGSDGTTRSASLILT